MASVTITVCDICGDRNEDVTTYRIHREHSSRKFDLCAKHGAAIEEIWEVRQARTLKASVTTIEEIERRKRKKRA